MYTENNKMEKKDGKIFSNKKYCSSPSLSVVPSKKKMFTDVPMSLHENKSVNKSINSYKKIIVNE